mgnify:CR=1 FL=1
MTAARRLESPRVTEASWLPTRGVRPVEQGEGDSFVLAFTRASECRRVCTRVTAGTACADPAANRGAHGPSATARRGQLRGSDHQQDCATARSGSTAGQTRAVGCDRAAGHRLAARRRVADRSGHSRCEICRPERVAQVCHPDLRNEFATLRHPTRALRRRIFRSSSPVSSVASALDRRSCGSCWPTTGW